MTQSAETMTTNVAGNQYNKELFEAKLRKCNVLQSNVIQTARKVDSTQGVLCCINTIAWCQPARTRASNIAGNADANPRKQSMASQSTKTTATNVASDQNKDGCQPTRTRAPNVAGKAAERGSATQGTKRLQASKLRQWQLTSWATNTRKSNLKQN